ncbi:MAG: hypothetical protein FWB96_01345 [Defluviitaleaceae bacterium]|nr:hypothetical protein [Defluviitaleaceae bacterium]MCL2261662.1 hypothetical protein [Defluviitaleaceae bacterium]
MLIGKLGQHCGECGVIDHCGAGFGYSICRDERFADVDDGKYSEIANGNYDIKTYEGCVNCKTPHEDCQGAEGDCEHGEEEANFRARQIADYVNSVLLGENSRVDIDAIRARCEAASPGKWSYFPKPKYKEHHVSIPPNPPGPGLLNLALFPDGCPTGQADAEFIAHAREDIPALLREVERLRTPRVAELLEADKDGRVFILPYHIGQTLYRIERDGCLHHDICDNRDCDGSEKTACSNALLGTPPRIVQYDYSPVLPSRREDIYTDYAEAKTALAKQRGKKL